MSKGKQWFESTQAHNKKEIKMKRFKGMKFENTNFYKWYQEKQAIKRDIAIMEQFRFSDEFAMDCTPVPIKGISS